MNSGCICWFFTHILMGILIFKGPTARRLYKSFGVNGLICNSSFTCRIVIETVEAKGFVILTKPNFFQKCAIKRLH
jgi:hypothetical protein